MNIRQIRDLLIDSVRLDRELHEHVGPAPLRGQGLPYVHSFSDIAGWGKKLDDKECQLNAEDTDSYAAFKRDFWDQFDRAPSPAEISRADAVHRWLVLVDDEGERRALLGWVRSKVGGKSFRRWCFQVEGISPKTGRKRKDRALEKIRARLDGRIIQHDGTGQNGGLQVTHDSGDFQRTIAEGADDDAGLNAWRSPDARNPVIDIAYESARTGNRKVQVAEADFSWAAKRNELRRKREAKRKKEEAKREAAKQAA